MSFLRAFKYRRKDTAVHRLDPRSKFLLSIILMAVSIVFTDIRVLLALVFGQIILLSLAGSLREWLSSLRGLLFFFAVIFATQLLFGGTLYTGFILSLRLLALSSSMSWFFLSSTPEDIGRAMSVAGLPIELTFSFTMAIRFIPVIYDEFQSIYDTQRSRGLELEKGGFRNRIRNLMPVLIPLLVGTIRRTYEIADAMEVRAFGASPKRTTFKPLRLKSGDYLVCAASAILVASAAYLKLLGIE
ncbi:MAG: energy-coupling factor transporter transmembrane protein EcfT [Candidatus Brockarchaeota archaeon]|nr:energy-coupling factor transporter transmembrane protein EcfT [Candidatus Brockarchaeota archaeon]MBO3808378.1 energy-coupling factor transporter transmembrane protein EcfT [Candidatus Brockarchaeota archaeon]